MGYKNKLTVIIAIGLLSLSTACFNNATSEEKSVDTQKNTVDKVEVSNLDEILALGYVVDENGYTTVTKHVSVQENGPEMTLDFRVRLIDSKNGYNGCILDTIKITNPENSSLFQEFSLPQYTYKYELEEMIYDLENIKFEVIDLNTDGYNDFKIFDTMDENFDEVWMYFVWNQDKGVFEYKSNEK